MVASFLSGFRRAVTLATLLGLAQLMPACRDATQIVLNIHTNMPCGDGDAWEGVAVYVGEPGRDVEMASPTLVTTSCDEHGTVGSLVVVPSGSNDSELGVNVVAGIARNPEQCAEEGYKDCIVARRALRYTPHDSLELSIELTRDCVSVACDTEHTCHSGRCVESDAIQEDTTPAPITGPSVRCGDDGVRCSTEGDVCCLTVHPETASATGDCRPAALCDRPSIVLHCDDDTDCEYLQPLAEERGGPPFCSVNYTHTETDLLAPSAITGADCGFFSTNYLSSHYGLGLCQEGEGCLDRRFPCDRGNDPQLLPNYLWCALDINRK